jgi:hypothetical protein
MDIYCAHHAPAQVLDTLLETLLGGTTTDDDVALLVVEHGDEDSDHEPTHRADSRTFPTRGGRRSP